MPGSVDFWMGKYADRVLLFDPGVQVPGHRNVFLWNAGTSAMETYVRDRARQTLVKQAVDPNVVAAYRAWRAKDGDAWIAAEVEELLKLNQRLQAKKAEKIDRHRVHVESLGLRYQGYRQSSLVRATNCWKCKARLSSEADIECVVCGWLLCECGGCGCGRAAVTS